LREADSTITKRRGWDCKTAPLEGRFTQLRGDILNGLDCQPEEKYPPSLLRENLQPRISDGVLSESERRIRHLTSL
jgi:hypothetical protein